MRRNIWKFIPLMLRRELKKFSTRAQSLLALIRRCLLAITPQGLTMFYPPVAVRDFLQDWAYILSCARFKLLNIPKRLCKKWGKRLSRSLMQKTYPHMGMPLKRGCHERVAHSTTPRTAGDRAIWRTSNRRAGDVKCERKHLRSY